MKTNDEINTLGNITFFPRCASKSYYWKRKNVHFVGEKWCFRKIDG
jgi:hypothetical protein